MTEFKRPFGLVDNQHNRFVCACGTRSKLPESKEVPRPFIAICPECETSFIPVGSWNLAREFTAPFNFDPDVVSTIGYQEIPYPMGGIGIAYGMGQKFPEMTHACVTSKGNFALIINYVRYDAFFPGLSKRGKDKAHDQDSIRGHAISRFVSMMTEGTNAIGDPLTQEDIKLKTLADLPQDEANEVWDYCTTTILNHLAQGHKICTYTSYETEDTLWPIKPWVNNVQEDQIEFGPHGFLSKHRRAHQAKEDEASLFVKKVQFDRTFILKDDGRIFHLNGDNLYFKNLYADNREAYNRERAMSKKFRFATGNSLWTLWRTGDSHAINFTPECKAEINRRFNLWLGHKVELGAGNNIQAIVEHLYNRMVLINSKTFSQRVLTIARSTGLSDAQIIQHGADGAVYGFIGKEVTRKQFRKELTAMYASLESDCDARLFSAKLALGTALSHLGNHGLASSMFYGMDTALKQISETASDKFNRADAQAFVAALDFFEEILSPKKLIEFTSNTLEVAIAREATYVMSNLTHDLQDAARAARTCIDGGISVEALRAEINRVQPDWSSIHNHLYRLANAVRNEAKLARMQNFAFSPFQEGLNAKVEGFDFVTEHPTALHNVGAEMSICVGSYAENVYDKSMTIVTMRKEGRTKYHACLEINTADGKTGRQGYSPSIRQAKLSCNSRIGNDKEALKALRKWAKSVGLDIQTSDVSGV